MNWSEQFNMMVAIYVGALGSDTGTLVRKEIIEAGFKVQMDPTATNVYTSAPLRAYEFVRWKLNFSAKPFWVQG